MSETFFEKLDIHSGVRNETDKDIGRVWSLNKLRK